MRVEGPEVVEEAVVGLMLECGIPGTSSAVAGGRVTVIGYLPSGAEARIAELRSRLARVDPCLTEDETIGITLVEVADEDWVEAWKQHFKPTRVGRRIVVRPSWEEYEASRDDLVITLDPGMAFGTGGHATTQLCVRALEERLRGGESVIDVGCGSGILAIAAMLLGAESGLAIDNDQLAIRVCLDNVARNGVQDRITVHEGTGLEGVAAPADVIVANISAEAVVALAPEAAALLQPGGWFIASGFTARGLSSVRKAMDDAQLAIAEEQSCGEWICVIAEHAARAAGG